MNTITEQSLQSSCYKWFYNTHYIKGNGILFHIPNGGSRNKREATLLKAVGVLPGIPDLALIYRGNLHLFELKTITGKLSPEQIKMHERLLEEGYPVYVIRHFEDFRDIVASIINPIHDEFGIVQPG